MCGIHIKVSAAIGTQLLNRNLRSSRSLRKRLRFSGQRLNNHRVLKILNNPFRIQGEDNGDMNGVISFNDPLDPQTLLHHGCKDPSLSNIVTSKEYANLKNINKKSKTKLNINK